MNIFDAINEANLEAVNAELKANGAHILLTPVMSFS